MIFSKLANAAQKELRQQQLLREEQQKQIALQQQQQEQQYEQFLRQQQLLEKEKYERDLEIENIKEAYSTLQFALNALNDYLTDLKDKYPKYQIIVVNNAENTTSETFYPGYKTFINKEVEIREQNNLDQFGGSVVNIVADKINLISHKNDKNFSLTDRSENITTASQIEINTKASPMVNGDIVYKLLELMRFVIINHVHPYSGLPTDPDKLVQDLRDFDLDSILNKNIRLS